MPVLDRNSRNEAINELPYGLRDLCSGEIQNELLVGRCSPELPLTYSDSEGWLIPVDWDEEGGPVVVPLWEVGTSLVARREGPFSDYFLLDLEEPTESFRISKSEQGLLSYLFYFLVEDLETETMGGDLTNRQWQELTNLASQTGFLYLDEVVKLHLRIGGKPGWMENLLEFTRGIE